MIRRTRLAAAVAAGAIVVTSGAVALAAPADSRSGDRAMQPFRAITKKYHDPARAVADGFAPTDVCVEVPQLGGMGYHYVNHERFDDKIQLGRPEAVLYAPTADGGRRLVAVEYLAIDADQDLSTDDDRPSLKGVEFDGPMPGHEPGMPVHYDLHVWAWEHNPAGDFAAWNKRITC